MLKRNLCITLILTLILSLFANTFTCLQVHAYEKRVSRVKLNDGRKLTLEVGDIKKLDYEIYPKEAVIRKIKFTSKNSDIVSVDSKGVVKALKLGKTYITIDVDHHKSQVEVEVCTDKNLLAKFSDKGIVKNKVKEVTISLSTKNGIDYSYYICLPNGYIVNGNTATYTIDRNGLYPFTVYYYTGKKKTFIYEEKNLENSISEYKLNYDNDNSNTSIKTGEFDINILKKNITLEYDYEKKKVLFKSQLDKNRSILMPNNSLEENNEITYFLNTMDNGKMYNYNFTVDNKTLTCKVIRQGEYYLLMLLDYYMNDTRNMFITYKAYNFCSKSKLLTNPISQLINENGNYTVEAYSKSGLREIFNIPVQSMDYTKPSLEIALTSNKIFEITSSDNYKLDYIINYDGKYIKVDDNLKPNNKFTFTTNEYKYNGDYIFTAIDTHGNRKVCKITIKNSRSVPFIRYLSTKAHNSNLPNYIFKDVGLDKETAKNTKIFQNIFPSYMRGNNSNNFKPNSTITRAQMITILCRITNLPYDITLMNKNRYIDIDTHWAKHYICMGNKKRYINGYRDKTFRPDNTLTRADFCQMMCNISTIKTNLNNIPAIYNYDFNDINKLRAKPYILKLANRGIIKGYNNKFCPNVPIKKYEVIYAINKLFNISPSKDEMTFIENTYNKFYHYTDIKNHPNYKDIIISLIGNYVEKKEFN